MRCLLAALCLLVVGYTFAMAAEGSRPGPPGRCGAAPTVTGISQTQGTTAGGIAVVVTGTALNTASAVSFGATSAGSGWFSSSYSSLTVSSPAASAGTVDITVTNACGQSATSSADQFTYVTPSGIPTVTAITPNNAPAAGGDTISVTGTNILDSGCSMSLCKACFGATCTTIFPAVSTGVTFAIPAHAAGTVHITLVNSSGTSVATGADLFTYGSPPSTPAIPIYGSRPSYNHGNGFFVVGRGIYDANGNLFTPVGANRTHFDWSEDERFATGLSAEREYPFFRSIDTFHSSAQEGLMTNAITNFVVPVPTIFNTNYDNTCPSNPKPSCATAGNTAISILNQAVAFFTTNGSTGTGPANWANTVFSGTSFTGNQIAWFDPANEWGPCTTDPNSGDFRIGWVSAVQAMRAAGYTAPIVVDAGCSGEGPDTTNADAVAIEAADPLHNVIFAVHVYGAFYNTAGSPSCGGCGFNFAQTMATLAQLTVPVIIEEFGCANCQDNGNVANPVSSDTIMTTTITNQMGYLAWAWDDSAGTYYCNNGAIPNCEALLMLGTDSFASPSQACYKNSVGTDITGTAGGTNVGGTYGHDVITFPTYGILAAAKVASVFTGTRPAPGTCPF